LGAATNGPHKTSGQVRHHQSRRDRPLRARDAQLRLQRWETGDAEVDWHVPRWFTDGRREHSVQALIDKWLPILKEGGVLFGALDGDVLAGLAMLRYKLSDTTAQLALLHVSRAYRRQGIATRLFREACQMAREDGAEELYVSATPSESAVGFYLSEGSRLAMQVNEELFAEEPEDIHMIKKLQR